VRRFEAAIFEDFEIDAARIQEVQPVGHDAFVADGVVGGNFASHETDDDRARQIIIGGCEGILLLGGRDEGDTKKQRGQP